LASSPFLCSPLKFDGLIFLSSPCKMYSSHLLLCLLTRDTWDTSCPWTCMSYSRWFPWRMNALAHAFWMLFIPMVIHFSMGFGCSHFSCTNCFLFARLSLDLPMQHIQNLKYLFMRCHYPFIILHIALHFSMHASHSYRFMLVSPSIRPYLIISHANMKTSDLLLMDEISMVILDNLNLHIIPKLFSCTSNSAWNVHVIIIVSTWIL